MRKVKRGGFKGGGLGPHWRAAALLRSDMCGGPKGGETSEPSRGGELVREEALVGSGLLPGPFEAGQISNTALATSLA